MPVFTIAGSNGQRTMPAGTAVSLARSNGGHQCVAANDHRLGGNFVEMPLRPIGPAGG
jgi:hypothetical protein